MDNPDHKAAVVNKIVQVLRKSTKLVKMAPFLYLLVFALYMLSSPLLPDDVLDVIDSVAYSSPITTMIMLLLSRIFRLCRWHVTACIIPSAAEIENFVDSFIISFTQNEVVIINLLLGLVTIVFLATAYKHFFHERTA